MRNHRTITIMKTQTKHIIILITASALAVLFGTSCGTVRGLGRDVGKVGHGIEHSAH